MTNQEKSELQKNILDSLNSKPHGRLLLAPRVGKTKLIIDLIKREKYKSILWITPSAKLAKEDIPEEFITWKAKRFLPKLTATTYAGSCNYTGKFDLVVFDEDQHLTQRVYNCFVNNIVAGSVISMTGTDSKSLKKHKLYKELGLSILYEIGIAQAIEIGLLSNYTIRVVQIDMSEEKNIVAGSKNKKFMTSEKKQYQYLTKSLGLAMNDRDVSQKVKQMKTLFRMRAIQNSPSKLRITKMLLQHLTGRVLIFAGSIRQAEELCKHTYHSKTDNKHYKMFQEEQIDRIAMVNTGGTGFTYTKLDHLVLVQADSDNNGITSQKIARTLLKQGDYQAKVWIICLMGTQDEEWIRSTLNKFDSTKISYKKK